MSTIHLNSVFILEIAGPVKCKCNNTKYKFLDSFLLVYICIVLLSLTVIPFDILIQILSPDGHSRSVIYVLLLAPLVIPSRIILDHFAVEIQ